MKNNTTRQTAAGSAWLKSRWQLFSAAFMGAAGIALAVASIWLADTTTTAQNQAQATLGAAQEALQNTQSDRSRLEGNLQLFGTLKQAHFSHAPDRLGILDTLETAGRDLRGKEVVWELGPQEKIRPLNDDKTGAAVAQLVRIPMKLSASRVHEEEWLGFLARLQNKGAGYYTTDSCLYEKSKVAVNDSMFAGLNVVCQLSWLYVVADDGTVKTP